MVVNYKDNNKLIAKNTIFLYFRMLLVMCVTLYTSRVVLQTLGASDYGIYNVVGSIVIMFSFLSGSLSGATSRYLAFDLGNNDLYQLKKTFSASLNIYLSIAIIIVFLGEIVGTYLLNNTLNIPPERKDAAFWVLQFSLITSFFSFSQYPFTASLIAHENMSIYAYMGIYEATTKLIIAFAITVSPIDSLIFYALLLMVNQVLILLAYRYYTIRKYDECRFRFIREKHLYKRLLIYTGYDMLPSMSSVAQNQGINILLNVFFGPISNAARAIAYQVNGAIDQLITNVIQAVRPQVIKNYAQGNKERMYSLVFMSSKYTYLLMLAIIIPLFFEMDFIIHLWLGNAAPSQTSIFCRIILLITLINTLSTSFSMAMHAIGKLRIFSLTNSFLYICPLFVGYAFFYSGAPDYSVFFVVLLFVILIFTNMLFLLRRLAYFSLRKYFKEVLFVCGTITIIDSLIPISISLLMPSGFVRFGLVVVVSELVLLSLIWRFAMDNNQRLQIKTFVKKKI